jgi:hypothetical protein
MDRFVLVLISFLFGVVDRLDGPNPASLIILSGQLA